MEITSDNTVFQIKGNLFTLTVLCLYHSNIAVIEAHLIETIKQAPKFFKNIPIILDLQKLNGKALDVDFFELIACLRRHTLLPIGIRGGNEVQHAAALEAGLAILPNAKAIHESTKSASIVEAAEPTSTLPASASKVIIQPVRSGQQIYARHGDLIVLSSVSSGAELLADGHIHIYGTLRGRALAGVSGNQEARIFCQNLEAELIAIAGHYWVSEDLQSKPRKENISIYLENEKLKLETIS